MIQSIDKLNFSSKKVLIRVDFNVPIKDGKVTDDTRIQAAMPTINAVISGGGIPILMTHLGRPKGERLAEFSLKPVAAYLDDISGRNIHFNGSTIGEEAKNLVKSAKQGDIVLLENLRFYNEETDGDEAFAKSLSDLADIYINDAFGTAHRAHASTTIVAKYFIPENRAFGYLMGGEIKSLTKALKEGKHPITAIIGGAKVSSKIGVLSHLLSSVDNIIIGGGMAYTFASAQGGQVGKSLVETDEFETARELLVLAKNKNVQIILPVDSVNSLNFKDDEPSSTTAIGSIGEQEMGLDIGPKSIEIFEGVIAKSSTLIWNGPMGVFEFEHYKEGTKRIGEAVSKATVNGAFSLVGGGDSVAAVKKFNLSESVSYVSTGGGAMLEYLEGKKLPGIAAMEQ